MSCLLDVLRLEIMTPAADRLDELAHNIFILRHISYLFHARVRGSVPGLGGLEETKKKFHIHV